jgi:hypothetical protein
MKTEGRYGISIQIKPIFKPKFYLYRFLESRKRDSLPCSE